MQPGQNSCQELQIMLCIQTKYLRAFPLNIASKATFGIHLEARLYPMDSANQVSAQGLERLQ